MNKIGYWYVFEERRKIASCFRTGVEKLSG
jgi:hypothetical protein